ncbi:MAG: ABC transporter ATP-binding protein [Bacteroides sp.]
MKDLKRLLGYLLPFKWRAIANIGFNVLGAFFSLFSLSLLIPFLGVLFGTMPLVEECPEFHFNLEAISNTLYFYISEVIRLHGKEWALFGVIVFIAINALLKNLFTYLASWHLAPIRLGIVRNLRSQLFHKILYLPLGYYTDERKGDIMSKMSNDVGEVEYSIMRSMDMFFKEPVVIIVHFIGLLIVSWHLTLFVMVLLPLSGLVIGRIGKNLKQSSNKTQQKLGFLFSLIEETLGGLRIVKAFNAEKRSYERFMRENDGYTKMALQVSRRQDLASPLSEFLGTVVMGCLLWYGGSLVFAPEHAVSPEALIGYMGLFYMILNPAKSFSSSYFSLLKGFASAERIDTILNAENPIKSPQKPLPAPEFKEAIEYRNVRFAYDQREILHGVNLTIRRGMTVALVGHSGSGKTTFVDLLPRFYDVAEGAILLDGHDIRDYRITDLRALMGNVNQEPILFNDTFYNNITFGVESATVEEVERAARIANAHDFIMETEEGYQTRIGDRGSRLSGGQRQRLSIARAILKNPPIMILDEATSSLDTASERLVQEALEHLMENRTSIVIAHRLSTIKRADLICVLDDGNIVEMGQHDELLERGGLYARLYKMQIW